MNLLIFFLFLFGFQYSCSESNQEKFLRANLLYNQGVFDKALEKYSSIPDSMEKWFNLGNCFYKLGYYAQAMALYKKAAKLAYSYKDYENINFNIQKTKEKLGTNGSDLNYSLMQYVRLLPMIYLQVFFLFIWYITFLLFRKLVNKKAYLRLFCLILISLITLGLIIDRYVEQNKKMGIIISGDNLIYAGPDKNYHIIGKLNLSDEVYIKKQVSGWMQISNSTLKGWVPANFIFIV